MKKLMEQFWLLEIIERNNYQQYYKQMSLEITIENDFINYCQKLLNQISRIQLQNFLSEIKIEFTEFVIQIYNQLQELGSMNIGEITI